MIVLSTASCAAALVCFLRVLMRGEVFKAGVFLIVAVCCGVWAFQLHVPGMRDFLPGPFMAIGILVFCMSCDKHETFVWNWVLGPLGQTLGGGLAIAGFIAAFLYNAW